MAEEAERVSSDSESASAVNQSSEEDRAGSETQECPGTEKGLD